MEAGIPEQYPTNVDIQEVQKHYNLVPDYAPGSLGPTTGKERSWSLAI